MSKTRKAQRVQSVGSSEADRLYLAARKVSDYYRMTPSDFQKKWRSHDRWDVYMSDMEDVLMEIEGSEHGGLPLTSGKL